MYKRYLKKAYIALAVTLMAVSTTACSSSSSKDSTTITDTVTQEPITEKPEETFDGTVISLEDSKVLVDGEDASTEETSAVYTGAEIIYYESGKDDTYGAGSEKDAHTAEEAAKHTVITITQPGTYKVTGKIEAGQIVVDLGDDAKKNPEAVVNLVLDNAEVTCSVAPAILVLHAYECGSKDTETATKDVDTTNAGFNLILADNSTNVLNGAHVAKIYEEGTTDKKYKFDAAVESKISFNINAGILGNGKLTVNSDNEGIESGLHLTINGGEIVVNSADDSINTNEDGVSVLTVNGGILTCDSGNGTEGDGIDSNGYIVMNGGFLISSANAQSQDSGIDSDMGIFLNGGTLLASGNMYDEVSDESSQNFMVLGFNEKISESDIILIKDANDQPVKAFRAVNDYSMLVYSSEDLAEGDYTLYLVSEVTGDVNGSIYTNITDYKDAVQLQYTSTFMMGMGGGMRPDGMQKPEGSTKPTDGNMPEMPTDGSMPEMPADGSMPEMSTDGSMPEMPADGSFPEMPVDGTMPQRPEGMEVTSGGAFITEDGKTFDRGQRPDNFTTTGEPSTIFSYSKENNTFSGISKVTE